MVMIQWSQKADLVGEKKGKELNNIAEKVPNTVVKITQFLFNPRFLFCFGIAWLITNGWSYILFGIGTYFPIGWMLAASTAYLAFLWIPFSPEKIVTVGIAMGLLRVFFPNDKKRLAY